MVALEGGAFIMREVPLYFCLEGGVGAMGHGLCFMVSASFLRVSGSRLRGSSFGIRVWGAETRLRVRGSGWAKDRVGVGGEHVPGGRGVLREAGFDHSRVEPRQHLPKWFRVSD